MNLHEAMKQTRMKSAAKFSSKMLRRAHRRQPGVDEVIVTVHGKRERDLLLIAGWEQVDSRQGLLAGTTSLTRFDMRIRVEA